MLRALMALIIGLSSTIALSGCNKADSVIACAASEKLKCPLKSIQVKSFGTNQYVVSGCGKNIKISCKGPADGCIIDETGKPFPTAKCQ